MSNAARPLTPSDGLPTPPPGGGGKHGRSGCPWGGASRLMDSLGYYVFPHALASRVSQRPGASNYFGPVKILKCLGHWPEKKKIIIKSNKIENSYQAWAIEGGIDPALPPV